MENWKPKYCSKEHYEEQSRIEKFIAERKEFAEKIISSDSEAINEIKTTIGELVFEVKEAQYERNPINGGTRKDEALRLLALSVALKTLGQF